MQINRSVQQSLNAALALASQHKHPIFTVEHLLWAILQSQEAQEMLSALNVSSDKMLKEIYTSVKTNNSPDENMSAEIAPSLDLHRVLSASWQLAQQQENQQVNIWMVLLNMLDLKDSLAVHHLTKYGINSKNIKLFASHGAQGLKSNDKDSAYNSGLDEGVQESALSRFAVNLNERALENKIDPLIGRAYEIQRTAQILSRRRKNNPLLVGEPGVGKTAIAEGLAKLIVDGQVPEALEGKIVMSLNVGAMLAGTKFRGDFEQRIQNVLEEAKANPDIILFIDEIHTIIGAGSGSNSSMDASNLIKPALASGELRVIGATTFQEYREVFEKEKALDRRFMKVDVVEPTPAETIEILKGLKKTFEEHHGVKYSDEALESAVNLSVKYLPDRFLPDKAIDLLDEAGSVQRLLPKDQRRKIVNKTLIEETISSITRLPISQVSQDEKDNLETLADDLRSQVFGQDKAIETLSTAVCISKAGLNDDGKPLGSFLFAGPTGVGKTEIVKQLSKNLGMPLLRFDMSEYMESHSVARLIGSPPGYVGHDKGGLLTDAVFKSPHSVLLLDEIEKAHPDILNLLLQVLDHGSLTDSNGRTVNFKNLYVIMTTNAGAQAAQKASIGFLKADRSTDAKQVLNASFPPEFRNRLDAIVSFNSLGQDEILRIVEKNIRLLTAPLAEKNVTLDVSAAVREKMAKDGFDPLMGARPMARMVQDQLKKPLATMILFGALKHGGHASVDLDDNAELVWSTKPLAAETIIQSKVEVTVDGEQPVKKVARKKKTITEAPVKKRATSLKM